MLSQSRLCLALLSVVASVAFLLGLWSNSMQSYQKFKEPKPIGMLYYEQQYVVNRKYCIWILAKCKCMYQMNLRIYHAHYFSCLKSLRSSFFCSFVILHYVSHFNSELVAKSAVFSCIYIHLVYCVMGIMRMILNLYNYCKTIENTNAEGYLGRIGKHFLSNIKSGYSTYIR